MVFGARFARRAVMLAGFAVCTTAAHAEPFTYQGRLDDTGPGPAPASYEMEFRVFDDQTIGAPDTQIGLPLSFTGVAAIPVTNGLFTATLEFGPEVFTGPNRYLEIRVRRPGAATFTTLPRQRLTPSPQSIFASTAGSIKVPMYLEGPPFSAGGSTLWVNNTTPAGGGVHGGGQQWGVVGYGGTILSYFGAIGPTGVYGIGESNGTVGTSSIGIGVYGASRTGIAGLFELPSASSTTNALECRTWGTGRAAYFTRVGSSSTNPIAEIVGEGTNSDMFLVTVTTSPGATSSAIKGIISDGSAAGGYAVHGVHNGSGVGVRGISSFGSGVRGDSITAPAVYGSSSISSGVYGTSTTHRGGEFYRTSTSGTEPALYAETSSASPTAFAVHGVVAPTSPGAFSAAVRGQNYGTAGSGIGVWGSHDGSGWGVYATSASGAAVNAVCPTGTAILGATTSGFAGRFQGNVHVTGNLTVSGSVSKGSGTFRIDHPLDPENKFLVHSFVESPEMKNIYDGIVTLDGTGEAIVALPSYFDALNTEFRYQLTCVGGYAPVYVSKEIADRKFRIAGGTPGLKVSWQVTGVRHDPHALRNPVVVEVEKSAAEKGKYLDPEAYGLPKDRGIGYDVPTQPMPGSGPQ